MALGTKMAFAGLGKPEDRAAMIIYLNSEGSNLPLPPPPAASEEPAAEEGAEAPAAEPAEGEDEAVPEAAPAA